MTRISMPHLQLVKAPQPSEPLHASSDNVLLGFVDMSRATDVGLETMLSRVRPGWIFDLRPVPYFNVGSLNRKRVFELFRSSNASYRDVAGMLRITEHKDASLNSGLVGSFLSQSLAMRPLKGPIMVLVDDDDTLAHAMNALPRSLNSVFNTQWLPVALDVQHRNGEPDLVARGANGETLVFQVKWLGDRAVTDPPAADVLTNAAGKGLLVRRLDPKSTERDQVLRLYRANSGTLGFFPKGALDEFVNEGCVLVALDGTVVVGYLAYRVTGASAKIVHLCVDAEIRGKGIARALADELFRETSSLEDVRLLCREDYSLTSFWPRLGFVCASEKSGRGNAGKKLFLWVRRNTGLPPLLAAIDAAERGNRRTAVVDANVLYDFDGTDERSMESQSLLADWLADDVAICVTAEIKNEITRNLDPETRARRRRQADEFPMLEATADKLKRALYLIESLLPTAKNDADASDRRQLAHTVAERADFFITRDETLLAHADILRAHASIAVLRPTDFLVQLHAQTAERYAPARLVATSVFQTPVRSEAELSRFQRFAASEPKAQWLQRLRPLLSDPHRFETTIVSWDGVPQVAYSIERTSGAVNIPLLRSLSDPRTPTVLRRVLAEILSRAQQASPVAVRCDDLGDPLIESALSDLGFMRRGDRYEKWTMRAIVSPAELGTLLPAHTVDSVPANELERVCWPLKVHGEAVPSFVVPIRPHWAAQLFDSELASQDLFGARFDTALALENVYYSSSQIAIGEGARMLWYVSDTVQAVRAASISLGTVRGTAKQLFRRFSRLGIYSWADLMRKTGGDPDKPLFAYRFAYTERLPQPVGWAQLQAILEQRNGRGNPFAGPTRIDEQVYFDVYRAATGL